MRVNSNGHVRRSDSEWQSIVSRFNNSNQTIKEFCGQENLVLSTFKRWQGKIADRPPARFVDLTPDSRPASDSSWTLDIDLPGGVRLKFRS